MLIKFNEKRTLGFTTKSGEEIQIIPGVNDLDDDVWNEMKDHPTIKKKMDNDELEEIKGAKGASGVGQLLRMKDKDAVKMAKDTVDKKILEEWNSKEKRPAVKKALQAQLDELANVEFRDDAPKNEDLPSEDQE